MEVQSKRKLIGRIAYFILAVIFALCVVVQFLLAGMATFISPAHWMRHTMFVHLFGFNIPVLMLIAGMFGAFPRWVYWQLLEVLFLVFLMYFTANVTGVLPWAAVLHPVIAAVLLVLAMGVVLKVWKFLKKGDL